MVKIATGSGPPIAVSSGVLAYGIDPRTHDVENIPDEKGELLIFGVGVKTAATIFTIAEAKLDRAWTTTGDTGEMLHVVQGPVGLTISPQ